MLTQLLAKILIPIVFATGIQLCDSVNDRVTYIKVDKEKVKYEQR